MVSRYKYLWWCWVGLMLYLEKVEFRPLDPIPRVWGGRRGWGGGGSLYFEGVSHTALNHQLPKSRVWGGRRGWGGGHYILKVCRIQHLTTNSQSQGHSFGSNLVRNLMYWHNSQPPSPKFKVTTSTQMSVHRSHVLRVLSVSQ